MNMNKVHIKVVVIVIIVISLFGIAAANSKTYATQVTNNGNTASDTAGPGTAAWTNPTYALTNDSNRATVTVNAGAGAHYIQVTGYGFAIPANAVINSFTINMRGYTDGAPSTMGLGQECLVVAGVTKCNAWGGGQSWLQQGSEGVATFSIQNDATQFGNAAYPITPAQVNASNFGVVVTAWNYDSVPRTANINEVTITVDYTSPAAPTANTDATLYSVRSTDAILTGSVQANALATTAGFRWGTSYNSCSALPNSTSTSSVSAGGSKYYYLSQPITGLTQNTTYYFCIYATNSSGTTYGTVNSFTTVSTASNATNATSAQSPTASGNTGIGTYNGAWSTVTNQYASDGAVSSCSATYPSTPFYCSYLLSYGYGFNVPANATITGIAVDIKGSISTDINDSWNVQLYKNMPAGTGYIGQIFPQINNISHYTVAGGSTNLWSGAPGSITPADVNSSNFGVWISNTYLGGGTYNIDHVRVTVYYLLPQAPTLSTPTSASVVDTSATLGGTVTGQGGSALTARGVCYAVTATNANPQSGGTGVTCVPEGGTSVSAFTMNVSGLSPNTAYSYTAYATNTQGTGYTSAGTFTTLGPPTVTTSAAGSLTTTTAVLNGVVDPNGGTTNVNYLWGDTNASCLSLPNTLTGPTGLTGTANISPNATALSTLSANTTYYFCVMATNSYGTTYGTVLNFTTSPTPGAYKLMDAGGALGGGATDCDDTAAVPCPPTGVGATPASATQINVAWSAAAGPAATSYDLVWCSGSSCTPSTTITGVTSTYAHTGRTCNTVYGYQLIAKNAQGSSSVSGTAYGTTSACSSVPTVTTSTASNITATSVTFTSIVNPNSAQTNVAYNFGTVNTTCNLLGSQNNIGSIGSGSTNVSPNTANQTSLVPSTTYYYCALATNSNGTTYGSVLSFRTLDAYVQVDTTYQLYSLNEIAMPSDNIPVMAWQSGSGGVRVAKCSSTACTGMGAITSLAASGNTGTGTRVGIAISGDGLPIVVYETGGSMMAYKCTQANCSTGTTTNLGAFAGNINPSVAVGSDGLPVISHNAAGQFRVFKCNTNACTGGTDYTLYSATVSGAYSKIAIVGGYPVMFFEDDTNLGMRYLRCSSLTCNGVASTTLLATWGSSVPVPSGSIRAASDGLPIMIFSAMNSGATATGGYQAQTSYIFKCTNIDCTAKSTYGGWASSQGPYLDVPADGNPVATIPSASGGNKLMFIKCTTSTCSSYNAYTPVTGLMNWPQGAAVETNSSSIPFLLYPSTGTPGNGTYIMKCSSSSSCP